MREYEKEYLRELGRKCIEYIKCNKIYKEDGYWKDLIFCLEEEQYGDFIKKVLNSFVYGVTCDFAYKMLEVLNKSTTFNNANELIMLEEALEQAKKEHELLELYREYHIVQENSEFYKRLYRSLLESNRDYHDDYLSYKRCEEDKDKIIERIMKLEEELKVKE